ncbi:hypothetical protein Ocin01_06267 [Orchesella cincta]|uniref:Uncharacterized protein n=1 Tax=Orchesella cincta TaxID=48709 RepID=A0A1D2N573_ORCCI|nr:hypothetical protein Ocin01_06267 [Orchesella cincta]
MSKYFLLLVVVIAVDFKVFINATFIKSRTWHEEFVADADGTNTRVLYPRYKICRAPREKPETLKTKDAQQITGKHSEVSWANYLAIYTADSGAEIYNWDFQKQEPDPNKATRWTQFISIIIFLVQFSCIFTIFIFIVPLVGSGGFKFYSLVWYVIFHPEVRRLCRRMFIEKEKMSRKHVQKIIAKAGKQAKRQFRLPFILREYNEEEIPAELMQSEEDSDQDLSSDAFENLLIKKVARLHSFHETKELAKLIASTEEEVMLENDGKDSNLSKSSIKPNIKVKPKKQLKKK